MQVHPVDEGRFAARHGVATPPGGRGTDWGQVRPRDVRPGRCCCRCHQRTASGGRIPLDDEQAAKAARRRPGDRAGKLAESLLCRRIHGRSRQSHAPRRLRRCFPTIRSRRCAAGSSKGPSGAALVVRCPHAADPARLALSTRALGPIDSFIRARLAREAAESRRRPIRHAHPAGHARSDRPAADARRGRCLPRRRVAGGLREGRRSAARVAALRRADGGPTGSTRPALRRHERLSERRRAVHVAVARLGDRRLQQQPAVRPVHDRATRRRPAAERHARPAIATGFQPQPSPTAKAGSSPKEFAVEYVVDRVETTAPSGWA